MDSESLRSDPEAASPETNYFKMMMEDNQTGRVMDDGMDDSIIGGQTLASMMNTGVAPRDSNTIESSQQETMSIVGVDDDISTIANDTVNETTKAFFLGNGSSSKPRIRLFKEYITPEKKTRTKDIVDDDEETVPETPPGMIRVPGGSRSSGSYNGSYKNEQEQKNNGRKDVASFLKSKRIYVIAGVLALILFISIIALSVALSGMRKSFNNNADNSLSAIGGVETGENVFDNWPDLDSAINDNTQDIDDEEDSFSQPPTIVPTEAPFEDKSDGKDNGEDDKKKEGDKEEKQEDNSIPVSDTPPTEVPTVDTTLRFDATVDVLVDRNVIGNAKELEKNRESPQYYATEWLSQDPSYSEYSEDRLIQRWSLAALAYSLDSSSLVPMQRRRAQQTGTNDWLTYTDECTWFTSSTEDPCDKDGLYTRIDIQDIMLGGTLPTELSLLSNSLQHIILDGTALVGEIPKEINSLSNLVTLRLRRNNLEGRLKLDFWNLNVQTIDLGENSFVGNVPDDIVYLEGLTELSLDHNSLTGQIPWEIGNLQSLTTLQLSDNMLSGWVPDGVGDLKRLKILTLGNNNLSGDLPKDVCRIKNMSVLSVDCAAQGCECCTECATTASPTRVPTLSPTISPSAEPSPAPIVTGTPTSTPSAFPTASPTPGPTQLPTSAPTVLPTGTPTSCIKKISTVGSCFAPSVDIEIQLSNCNIDMDDWVGIYPLNDAFNSQALGNPNIWSWSCGTRNCRVAVTEHAFILGDIHAGGDDWPMEPGTYVAILAGNSAMPYTAGAVSEPFTISEIC